MPKTMEPSRDISRLVQIMSALRDPAGGCPWDLEQDFASIRHYTIEEAYEVADAIERGAFDDLRDELGDLLLQPVYLAQMARERGLFDFGDVVETITAKLIRRHPHVFGEESAASVSGAKARWDDVKATERAGRLDRGSPAEVSLLDDVPRGLPALALAARLSSRAGTVGFDWPDWRGSLHKVNEELGEVRAVADSGDAGRLAEEIGDALFAMANLARKLGVDAEAALRDASVKFDRRFRHLEARCREDGVPLAEAGLDRLEAYWNEVRAADKG